MSTSRSKPIIVLLIALTVITLLLVFNKGNRQTKSTAANEEAITRLASLKAYDLYLQGRSFWNMRNEASLRKGLICFIKATELDSDYAPAFAGIADCYTALGYGSYESPEASFLPAEKAARRALQLDSGLAEAYTSMGYIKFYYYWDWSGAEQEFLNAQQIEPRNELSYSPYTYLLTSMQRFPEAIKNNNTAIAINPLSSAVNTDKGFALYYSGQYDAAIETLMETMKINAKNPLTHLWLGRAYQEKKKYNEAISEYRQTLLANKDWVVAWAAIGSAFGYSRDSKSARSILDTLQMLSEKRFVTPYAIALVYASVNDREKAFEWLYKAYNERSHWMVWLALDPRWSSIRTDKRFGELLVKMGLDQRGSVE